MMELLVLPLIIIAIAGYVTWIEIKSNRPFNWACLDGLANGMVVGFIYICIVAGSHG